MPFAAGLASPTLDRGGPDGCHRREPKGERAGVSTSHGSVVAAFKTGLGADGRHVTGPLPWSCRALEGCGSSNVRAFYVV